MKQYKILTASGEYSLSKLVKERLINGWVCQGGVSMVYYSGYKEIWAQAMVKL